MQCQMFTTESFSRRHGDTLQNRCDSGEGLSAGKLVSTRGRRATQTDKQQLKKIRSRSY